MSFVVELCPHCDIENMFEWDVKSQGYLATCQKCGKEMMLCDECMHSDDFRGCDWHIEGSMSVCCRGTHKMWED